MSNDLDEIALNVLLADDDISPLVAIAASTNAKDPQPAKLSVSWVIVFGAMVGVATAMLLSR